MKNRAMRGIYPRGKVYWLSVQKNNKRQWISLKTSDPAEAIRKAARHRQQPHVVSGGLIVAALVSNFPIAA